MHNHSYAITFVCVHAHTAPPVPKRGIIKNRIAPGLQKMRRQRVKWDQQEGNMYIHIIILQLMYMSKYSAQDTFQLHVCQLPCIHVHACSVCMTKSATCVTCIYMYILFPAPPTRPSVIPRRRARRADTNVLAVKFNTLTGPSHVHTGDLVVCSNPTCTAILSHLSQLRESTGEDKDSKV